MLVYLDADVLLNAFLRGPNTRRAQRVIDHAGELAFSNWTRAEVASALSQRVRRRLSAAEEARAIVGRIDAWLQDRREVRVEDVDIEAATQLLERFDLKLRTGDALHLAISRRLDAHLATFDNDLASAAEAVGQRLVRG